MLLFSLSSVSVVSVNPPAFFNYDNFHKQIAINTKTEPQHLHDSIEMLMYMYTLYELSQILMGATQSMDP